MDMLLKINNMMSSHKNKILINTRNLIVVSLFITLIAFFWLVERNSHYKVIQVIDGDTLIVRPALFGEEFTIRLIGIDTPEMNYHTHEDPECYAMEATKFLMEAITDKKIYLEYDKQQKDIYDRTLAYVFVNQKNGHNINNLDSMINLQMAQNGFTRYLFIPPNNKYIDEIKAATYEAKSFQLGLWGDCK